MCYVLVQHTWEKNYDKILRMDLFCFIWSLLFVYNFFVQIVSNSLFSQQVLIVSVNNVRPSLIVFIFRTEAYPLFCLITDKIINTLFTYLNIRILMYVLKYYF